MIREFASYLFSFLGDAFGKLFGFLGGLFSGLLNGIKSVLLTIFEPILQLVAAIFYFLYKLGALIMAVIDLVFRMVFFFVYVMKGLFVTLIGLSYDGRSAAIPERYQTVFSNVQPALEILQIDKIPTILLFAVWVFIAVSIIKIIGSRG